MKFKGKELHWDSPMPTHPLGQRHYPPNRGDNKAAIRASAGHALDVNLTRACGTNWFLHYRTPARNGYTKVKDVRTGVVRKMTLRERRLDAERWGYDGIQRWRRPNGEAPLTEWSGVEYCVAKGTLPIRELKSKAAGTAQWAAKDSRKVSEAHDCPGWFKTLYNLAEPRGKVVMYQSQGLQVALIFGKFIAGRARRLAASRRIVKKWGRTRPNATW